MVPNSMTEGSVRLAAVARLSARGEHDPSASARLSTREEQPPPAQAVVRPTILVIDDEAPLRIAMIGMLAGEGYHCIAAGSCASAREVLDRQPVSLVLLDIHLEQESGLEFFNELRQDHPDMAILMVTGINDPSVACEVLRRGAVGYIHKPFDGFELRTQVYSALLQRDASRSSAAAERRARHEIPGQLAVRLALAARFRDADTGAHIARIGRFSSILARALGFSAEDADMIGLAATAHDLGKIAIPDAILLKPGKLTPEEFETMKQHTVIGAQILAGTDLPLLKLAEEIARSHHERWDGSGYPDGLRGEECPIHARIVAILDVYDALVHARVYKEAWEESRILTLFEELRGKHFEPRILDAFLASLPALRAACAALPDD
jgi:putative two-component system response regulator